MSMVKRLQETQGTGELGCVSFGIGEEAACPPGLTAREEDEDARRMPSTADGVLKGPPGAATRNLTSKTMGLLTNTPTLPVITERR